MAKFGKVFISAAYLVLLAATLSVDVAEATTSMPIETHSQDEWKPLLEECRSARESNSCELFFSSADLGGIEPGPRSEIAWEALKKSCENGDFSRCAEVGRGYSEGSITVRSSSVARNWGGQVIDHIQVDFNAAERYFTIACGGNPGLCSGLGNLYREKLPDRKSDKEISVLFSKACDTNGYACEASMYWERFRACKSGNAPEISTVDQCRYGQGLMLSAYRPKTLQRIRATGTPVPEIVVHTGTPDDFLDGSLPIFVLYDDRTVIFDKNGSSYAVKLNKDEYALFINQLRLPELAGRAGFHRGSGEATLSASPITPRDVFPPRGMPETRIEIYRSGAQASIRINGGRYGIPDVVLEAERLLTDFDHENATLWYPDQISVRFWPNEATRRATIPWPADWPVSNKDVPFSSQGSFMLPGSQLARSIEYLKPDMVGSRADVKILEMPNGSKWSADVRIFFPHDELWSGSNPELR